MILRILRILCVALFGLAAQAQPTTYKPLVDTPQNLTSFSSTGTDEGRGTAVDAAGNTYFAGIFTSRGQVFGTVTTITSAGSTDGYVGCLRKNGTLRYLTRIGGTGPDDIIDIAMLTDGRLAITGNFVTQFVLGADTLKPIGRADGFVAVLDTAGKPVWARRMGSSDIAIVNNDIAFCVTSAPAGGLVIAGSFGTNFTYGKDTAQLIGNRSQASNYVVRIDAQGKALWQTRVWGPTLNTRTIRGIVTDKAGKVYVTGSFRDSTGYGTPPVWIANQLGVSSLPVAVLGPQGQGLRALSIESSSTCAARGIALNQTEDQILLVGRYRDTLYAPTPTGQFAKRTGKGNLEGLVFCLDTNLVPQWHRGFTSDGNDYAISATSMPNGDWVATGSYQFECQFDSAAGPTDTTVRFTRGITDIFLSRYGADGTLKELLTFGGSREEFAYSVRGRVDTATGNYILATTGYFQDVAQFSPFTQTLTANPRSTSDAYWVTFSSNFVTSTKPKSAGTAAAWLPNPTPSSITPALAQVQAGMQGRLVNATGQTLWQGALAPGPLQGTLAQAWQAQKPGLYIIQCGNQNLRVVKE